MRRKGNRSEGEGRSVAEEEKRGRKEERKGQQGRRGGMVMVERVKIRKRSIQFLT